ncbi:MAG: acyl-CoA desaturase [Myxococcaceae bacterium]|nr:acyl-CoA desaturase [Myxococcaceae bacterium]
MTSRFLPHGPFFRDLQLGADGYFAAARLPRSATGSLWLKTAFILGWFVASWAVLVFVAATWWQAGLAAISLGLAMAGIGFNVQHDGGHRATSARQGWNRAMALTLDVLGGSSYLWHWKHNVQHHSTPNVAGLDVDIDIEPLVRLSPEQRWRPWHRYQHLYTWLLYALLAVKWHFVDDFKDVVSGRIGTRPFPRPRGFDLAAFVFGKLFFFTWAFVVPALFHPLAHVLLGYLVASVVLSLSLALTFQCAHCVPGASFPKADAQREWAEHQAITAVDFAPAHPLWTWYLGGLNYQLEHHLFPRVCHVHYPKLAPIVRAVCEQHGVPYRVLPGVGAALWSHARFLFQLGRQPVAAPVVAPAVA